MATSKTKAGKVTPRLRKQSKTKSKSSSARINKLSRKVTYDMRHNLVPLVVKKLKSAMRQGSKSRPNMVVCAPEIINSIYKHHGIKIPAGDMRTILHYIRVNGLVKCLVANSNGYYTTKDTLVIQQYIKSLRNRIRQIGALAKAIDIQAHEIIGRQYAAKPLKKATKPRKKATKKHGRK